MNLYQYNKESKESVVIRTCIMEDMNSQCGSFKFRGRKIRGCMLTCNDHLCNGAAASNRLDLGLDGLYDSFPLGNTFVKIVLGLRV